MEEFSPALTFQPSPDPAADPHRLVEPPVPLVPGLELDKDPEPVLVGRDLVPLDGVEQAGQDVGRTRAPPFGADHDVRRAVRVRRGDEVARVDEGGFGVRQELGVLAAGLFFGSLLSVSKSRAAALFLF